MEEGSHKNEAKERDDEKKEIWKEMAPSLTGCVASGPECSYCFLKSSRNSRPLRRSSVTAVPQGFCLFVNRSSFLGVIPSKRLPQ